MASKLLISCYPIFIYFFFLLLSLYPTTLTTLKRIELLECSDLLAKVSEVLLLCCTIEEQLLVDGFALPFPPKVLDGVGRFLLNCDAFETLGLARCAAVFFTNRIASIALKRKCYKPKKHDIVTANNHV